MLAKLTSKLREFCRSEEGTATVEFLLAMPLIIFWIGGSFTFFNAFSEYTRAVKATFTVADILSRQPEVDDDYIDNMNRLFANFMHESTNDVWIRVSSIEKDGNNLSVDWSTATGVHNALNVEADIPSEIIPDLVNGESIILVETYTQFEPYLDFIGISDHTFTNKIVVSHRFNPKLAIRITDFARGSAEIVFPRQTAAYSEKL